MNTIGNIGTAAREYYRRPADERYSSVDDLLAVATSEKSLSVERKYNMKDLRVEPVTPGSDTPAGQNGIPTDTLRLVSPRGPGKFTHWSFSQMCRALGAPAAYLRDIPARLAADCLNFGLQATAPGTDANILVRAPNGSPEPTIRACTSDTYGRLWDCELLGSLKRTILDTDQRWSVPPAWPGSPPSGLYRGDRDMFAIFCNGGSIVTDPTLTGRDDGTMFRGILIRNSEVGAGAVVLETILYRYICGNHMLWGAVYDKRFKRRHVGHHVLRDAVREISSYAWNWAKASADRDNAIIRALVDNEVAHTKEGVIDELRKLGASKEQAISAFETCERSESVSPRSFWGLAQGLTRDSQSTEYQDGRYELDRIAAALLAQGARLVHAA